MIIKRCEACEERAKKLEALYAKGKERIVKALRRGKPTITTNAIEVGSDSIRADSDTGAADSDTGATIKRTRRRGKRTDVSERGDA